MRWTEQEKLTLRRLYMVEKLSLKEIAAALNRTIPQVNTRLTTEEELGTLKRRSRRKKWKIKNNAFAAMVSVEYIENGITIKRYPAMYAWGTKPQQQVR